jgi:hypothetical protein
VNIYQDGDVKIDGEKNFELYCNLISSYEITRDFIKRSIKLKVIQGILSKFVFSIIASDEMKLKLIKFCSFDGEKYGYLKLSKNKITSIKDYYGLDKVHNYYSGLNDSALDDSLNFIF